MVNSSTFDRASIYHTIVKQMCVFSIPHEQDKRHDFLAKLSPQQHYNMLPWHKHALKEFEGRLAQSLDMDLHKVF
jgi:hypothetical protein